MTGTVNKGNLSQGSLSSNFNGEKVVGELNQSMNAMLLLNSSCQGIIEAEIQRVNSSWYNQLLSELGKAEMLVVHWRQNGFLYFRESILAEVISFGDTFLSSQAELDPLFTQLENNFSDALKAKISAKFSTFETAIQSMTQQVDSYQSKLRKFGLDMQGVHSEMNTTIGQVQAQEADIRAEINSINSQIANLQKQIVTDRQAIAKAKKARTRGIVETIFGVLLAPVTGGASLILAGIGVASIAEAENNINSMESQISKYQGQIAGDQTNLSNDQKTVATLHGLSMSVGVAIDDMNFINGALDSLKLTWGMMSSELSGVIQKLDRATNAQEAIVSRAWYLAACDEWKIILNQAKNLDQRNLPTATRKMIG